MNDLIHGYWHKTQRRCDVCHKPRKEVYVVKEGPTTGIFCGKQHYDVARKQMEEHEPDSETNTED